jgi:hypothetical protein
MIAQDFVFSGNFPRECRTNGSGRLRKFPEKTKHQQGREHIYEMSGLVGKTPLGKASVRVAFTVM